MALSAAQTGTTARHYLAARWRAATLRGAALTHFQDARARQIVAFAAAQAPCYRRHWAGHDLRDWRALPPMEKRLMMAEFDEFTTTGVCKEAAMRVALRAEQERDCAPTVGGLTVGLSSGTSGHRGLFLVSAAEQAGWAGVMLARALHRWHLPLRVAFFLRANSNLYAALGSRAVQFRYFDLMTPLEQAVAALNALHPHLVVGPPSLLGALARERLAGRLAIRPERLIAVAEVLEPQDEAALAATFDAPVHQIYQCTEGLLAISCRLGRLHLQEDLVALDFAPLPGDAERVTPIVTDLWRRAQPIVRYQLNDVLTLDPAPCPCGLGFRVVRRIEGRADDVCLFPAADGLRAVYPDTLRRLILLADPGIAEYQAVQARPGHLRIHLAPAAGAAFDDLARAVRASATATLAQYGCHADALEVVCGLEPETPGVKRRRVRRLVDPGRVGA